MIENEKFEKMCADGEVSGPCSLAAIDDAETALNVTFPQQYRDFLTNLGSGLFAGIEVYGLPDPVQNDPPIWQDVVKVTKQLREWGQAGADNPKYIPIAEDGTGVYFFIDTAAAPGTKILAIGPGVEREVSSDLFAFLVDLSEARIQF
jgi:cell wall assembly regulator SMI1